MQGTPAIARWDDVLRDSQFGCTGGRQTADGGAPGSHRTGRKEKPHQDNRFTVIISAFAKGKDIKRLQGKNRAELLGI